MIDKKKFFSQFGPLQFEALIEDYTRELAETNAKVNELIDVVKKLSPADKVDKIAIKDKDAKMTDVSAKLDTLQAEFDSTNTVRGDVKVEA